MPMPWSVADALAWDALPLGVRALTDRRVAQQVEAAVRVQSRELASALQRAEQRRDYLIAENTHLHAAILRMASTLAERSEALFGSLAESREVGGFRRSTVRHVMDRMDAFVIEAMPDDRAARILEEARGMI